MFVELKFGLFVNTNHIVYLEEYINRANELRYKIHMSDNNILNISKESRDKLVNELERR